MLVFLFLSACAPATPSYLASAWASPRLKPNLASVEFIRPGHKAKGMVTLVTETDGRYVAEVPPNSRTRAYVTPGRRLLFVSGAAGQKHTRAWPLWIDLMPGKTYLVHVDVIAEEEGDEMHPVPIRPDQVYQWQMFKDWREETRPFAVTDPPAKPVVSQETCKKWYDDYREMWEHGMNDTERSAHSLLPEDGR